MKSVTGLATTAPVADAPGETTAPVMRADCVATLVVSRPHALADADPGRDPRSRYRRTSSATGNSTGADDGVPSSPPVTSRLTRSAPDEPTGPRDTTEGDGTPSGTVGTGRLDSEAAVRAVPRDTDREGPAADRATESTASEAAAPALPAESAAATGTQATAEPIPRATARAPTRPMWMPCPRDAGSLPLAARSEYSAPATRR